MEIAGILISLFDPGAYISAEASAAPIATHIPYSLQRTYLVITGPSWFLSVVQDADAPSLGPCRNPPCSIARAVSVQAST